MESRPTVTESVVESADSAVESADSTTDSAADPVKIGLWVWVMFNICLSFLVSLMAVHEILLLPTHIILCTIHSLDLRTRQVNTKRQYKVRVTQNSRHALGLRCLINLNHLYFRV